MTKTMIHRTGLASRAPSWYESFSNRARSHADEPAVISTSGPGGSLTYAALFARVETLAGRLQVAGVLPDDVVAVSLERSADSVVAMLAVLAAGGAYCPLDFAAPPARTAAAVERLGVRVAVAGAALLPNAVHVPVTDTSPPGGTFTAVRPDPDSLAYVLHTSGSTGIPKAVAMTHRGLDRLIAWQVADGPARLRTLQYTATSFDVTFQEVLSTLATGGCLVLVSEQVRRDPDALLDVLIGCRAQRLFLPYVALQMLAVAAVRRRVSVPSLEHVITAGERLIATPAIRAFFAAVPHCRLDNHYGPTEAHLATSFTLAGAAGGWPEIPPIGSPVDGVACAVLDDDLSPVVDGEVGELYLGGTGLARGYLHDGARTGERFVADPSGTGQRLYRTGDLVRAAHHGLEFVGRTDEQLKVLGFRVEPAEVENALLHHPSVAAAAVALRDLADGVPALVAYLEASSAVPHRELLEHLRDRLPGYMIPARFVTIAMLPRTPSGKVDARALAALELPSAAAADDAGSLACTITAIWRRVLGHDEFDDDDDFFEIGGDSLLATWVVAEMKQELGSSLGLSVFLDDSTVTGLVAALEAGGAHGGRQSRSSELVTLRPGPSARSLYLVHPLGGELIGYRELVRASRAPFRLLGVAWTGVAPADISLEAIAATHVEQICAIQPEGPYLLAGWSFGGVLAYEMAQQLRASGAAVDLLGMIDANPVIDPLTGLPLAQTPFREMLDDLLDRLEDPACTGDELVEFTSGPVWTQLMGAPLVAGGTTGYLHAVLAMARACMNAAMHYEAQPYGGPMTLFQPAGCDPDRQLRLADALRGLCTGPFTTVPVTGDHWGVMRAPDMATQLDAALEYAEAEVAGVSDGS